MDHGRWGCIKHLHFRSVARHHRISPRLVSKLVHDIKKGSKCLKKRIKKAEDKLVKSRAIQEATSDMVQSGLPIQNVGVIREKVLEEHELEVHS